MSVYRFVTKRYIGSKVTQQTNNIVYFNRSQRKFSIDKNTLNSPEISDENQQNDKDKYFESLKQKSLLNDTNIQKNIDFVNKQKQRKQYERVKEKTEKMSRNEKYPEIFRSINNAKSGQQIKDLIIDYMNNNDPLITAIERLSELAQPPNNNDDNNNEIESKSDTPEIQIKKPAIFTHGMRACFALKEYKYGWELYDIACEKNCISNDLYSMVLFGKMHELPTNQTLKECFDIFDKWKEESKTGGLHINAKIYTSLISACMKIKNFSKAFHVYNNLMVKDLNENDFKSVLQSASVRQEIVNLYCRSQGVQAAIKFVSDCKIKYGILPTQNILSILIIGCAAEVNDKPELVEIAEKLFVSAFDAIKNENSTENAVTLKVFNALLVVYSKIGDYKSCIEILNNMEKNENWPNPDVYCIAPALKAISIFNVKMAAGGHDDKLLTFNEKWELIENILDIQKKNNLSHDIITYSILFHSCGGDRNKMMKLYDEMITKDKIMPNQLSLTNILLGGLDGFIKEIQIKKDKNESINELVDKDVTEFIDWVLMEMNKYNLPVSETIRYKLKTKLDIIKEFQ